MVKILHFADLHLETSFAADNLPPSVGSWRRSDLRATLGRIVTLALEQQVEAVTIGGDLFDQEYAPPELVDFLRQQFARLAPIRVFIAPGYHDPFTNNSLYALSDWPANVTIFSQGKLTAAELASGIHLWGAAHPPLREHAHLDGVHADKPGVNILLLHAAESAQNHDTFAINGPALQKAGFDFALLGGQHQGASWSDDAPYGAYPGSPEPLSQTEADGAHQILLLTIDGSECLPESRSIRQWRYQQVDVDLTGCDSPEDAARKVKDALSGGDAVDERLIIQVVLTGQPEFVVDIGKIAENCETKGHLQFQCRLKFGYDLEQLSRELTVRGTLARKSLEQLKNIQDEQGRHNQLNSLYFALQALEDKAVSQFHEVSE